MSPPKKTVIWRKNAVGALVRETHNGFPYGIPKAGDVVKIYGLGNAICSLGASDPHAEVHIVTLVVQ
jgi:hypothetical protein